MKSLLFTICSLIALQAQADHLRPHLLFSAKLDGAQQVPAVTTNAKGVASFVLNSTRDTMFVNASFVGLSGGVTAVHLHNGATGVSGGVALDLMPMLSGNKLNGIITGTNLSNNLANLIKSDIYLNVHTAANAGGEIRGQVKLETDWHFWASLNGANQVPAVTTTAYGLGSFNLSMDKGVLRYHIVCQGLSGAITSAHLHYGAAGATGGVAETLTFTGNVLTGTLTPSLATIDSLFSGQLYVNVHTAANANGEIRAQLVTKKGLVFDANLNGANQVPAVTTTASGVGSFYINPRLDTMWYDIVADGLSGAITSAHFHDGAAGATGGVAFTIPAANITGNRLQGFITGASFNVAYVSRLLSVDAYVNIHTTANANGEIRGQVLRLAREGYTINMTSAQNVPTTSNSAYGSGIVSISREQDHNYYMWVVGGLTAEPTAAHFHLGLMGASGTVIHNSTPIMTTGTNFGSAFGYWKSSDASPFTTANSLQFRNDSVYVNIHTTANVNGEVRGQVLRGAMMYTVVGVRQIVEQVAFNLMPNPTQDFITITADQLDLSQTTATIMDINGRVISRARMNSNQIDFSQFAAGTYFLQLNDGQKQASQKVIKY
jgi:hypothetical protein